MATDNVFNKALRFTLKWEGGLSDDSDDLGGRTCRGITQSLYNEYLKETGQPYKDVKGISVDEAKDIYYKLYWIRSGCREMKSNRLATVVFDTAVNMGVARAKQFLKDSNWDIEKFLYLRRAKYYVFAYSNLVYKTPRIVNGKDQSKFLEGWLNRVKSLKEFIKSVKEEKSVK